VFGWENPLGEGGEGRGRERKELEACVDLIQDAPGCAVREQEGCTFLVAGGASVVKGCCPVEGLGVGRSARLEQQLDSRCVAFAASEVEGGQARCLRPRSEQSTRYAKKAHTTASQRVPHFKAGVMPGRPSSDAKGSGAPTSPPGRQEEVSGRRKRGQVLCRASMSPDGNEMGDARAEAEQLT